jgi:hypothetical protein
MKQHSCSQNLMQIIFMKLRDGYARYMIEVNNVVTDLSKHVLLLKNTIYGLFQPDNAGKRLR